MVSSPCSKYLFQRIQCSLLSDLQGHSHGLGVGDLQGRQAVLGFIVGLDD